MNISYTLSVIFGPPVAFLPSLLHCWAENSYHLLNNSILLCLYAIACDIASDNTQCQTSSFLSSKLTSVSSVMFPDRISHFLYFPIFFKNIFINLILKWPSYISIWKILHNMNSLSHLYRRKPSVHPDKLLCVWGWLIRWMNTWIWQSSFFLEFPFIIRVLAFLNDYFSFSQNDTFIRNSMSGHSVVFRAGGEKLGRRREERWKILLGFPIELLETKGEEEIAPGSRVEEITEPGGPCLLTSSSRTSAGTSLC